MTLHTEESIHEEIEPADSVASVVVCCLGSRDRILFESVSCSQKGGVSALSRSISDDYALLVTVWKDCACASSAGGASFSLEDLSTNYSL